LRKRDKTDLEKEIKDELKFVNDENDAPFVSIALINKPCYILTYNIRDFKREELKKEGILVFSPNEMLEIIGVRKLDINSLMKRKGNITRYLLKWLKERKS
jgi:predicted nucleic acid-binding protein